MENGWSQAFTPAEREAAIEITKVANSVDWVLTSTSGLAAITLFVLAAHRSRQGDTLGCALSVIGAVISALAPIIAKNIIARGSL